VLVLWALALTGCGSASHAVSSTTTARLPHPKPTPANVVRIHWREVSLVAAARPGRICITTYRLGHFCASYRAGDVPADAMKLKLHLRGLKVRTIP
jgi:hypothetical protein